MTLRGFTYQAIAQLGERVPSAMQADTDIPRRFFHALAVESPGVRANLQETLSALPGAYKGCTGLHCFARLSFGTPFWLSSGFSWSPEREESARLAHSPRTSSR